MSGMGTNHGAPVQRAPITRDVVVTVPMAQWPAWIDEGDLPGQEAQFASHFWLRRPLPEIFPTDRVYIVAHGRVRGYAPLVDSEQSCQLRPEVGCLVRSDGAEAVTLRCQRTYQRMSAHVNRGVALPAEICDDRWQDCLARGSHPATVKGFRGWRHRWWETDQEIAFPTWQTDNLPDVMREQIERQRAATGSVVV
jgi:hypothetical protein